MTKVELIHVGTELLTFKVNTHTVFLANKLASLGLDIQHVQVVDDNLGRLKESLSLALNRSDLIIATGGLGPTFDDLTREAAGAALERRLKFHPEIEQRVLARFDRLGLTMPKNNKKQAQIIEGATVLENDVGTAPGQLIEISKKILVLLPGPPKELENTLDKALPQIARAFGQAPQSIKTFRVVGLPESHVEEKVEPLLAVLSPKYVQPTILASPYVIELIFRVSGDHQEYTLDKIRRELIKTFGRDYLGEDEITLESAVGAVLKERKKTLAVAESCTGGLLAHRLTNIAGSSAYFLGGAVCYWGPTKTKYLGVKQATIKKHGEVSAEVAREMALGALKNLKSDYALSVTGICGPSGGTAKKPVGLAWFGLGERPNKVQTTNKLFYGDREGAKERMASFALDLLRRKLTSL